MDRNEIDYLRMRKPIERRIATKKRNKKDERYLRRMSKQLELKNTVHSNKRIQQRFYSCSSDVKNDILANLDNCWVNYEDETYLIVGEYGKYVVGFNWHIVTVLKHSFLVGHFEKLNWRPKFTNLTQLNGL